MHTLRFICKVIYLQTKIRSVHIPTCVILLHKRQHCCHVGRSCFFGVLKNGNKNKTHLCKQKLKDYILTVVIFAHIHKKEILNAANSMMSAY